MAFILCVKREGIVSSYHSRKVFCRKITKILHKVISQTHLIASSLHVGPNVKMNTSAFSTKALSSWEQIESLMHSMLSSLCSGFGQPQRSVLALYCLSLSINT